ncbi:MAG: hypothetical protein WBC21_02620 [Minisyncoccales bacterium]
MMAIVHKIKKFLFDFIILKKTVGWILLFSVVLGLGVPIFFSHGFLIPPHWATWLGYKAVTGDFDTLGIMAKSFANGIVYVLFGAIAGLTSFFLYFSHATLQWVISPDFISVPFTNNPVVNLGWTTVRDFTNMLFILVLVVIALGSALRLKEYEVKKLLPVLIGIALLINFTPVICGFVIDGSNVVMNTFLKGGITSTGFIETAGEQVAEIKNIKEPSERLAIGIALSAFNIIGGIIFLLFAFLFAVRYLALWILVIFSPIAFFCYILPQTKEVWSKWWNQFIQWCIIGIPAAFFIYLTNVMIKNMSDTGGLIRRPSKEMAGLPSGTSGFADLIMYVIPLVFLIIGFFASVRTGAIGADKVIGFAKTGGTKAAKWTGGKIKETALVKGQSEKWRGRLEKIPETVGTGRMKAEAIAKHQIEREKEAEKTQKLLEPMSVKDREKYVKTPTEKLVAFRLATKEDHLGDKDEKNIDIVKRYGTQKDIIDAGKKRPDLAAKLNPEKVDEIIKKKPGINREEAEREVIFEKVQGMEPEELRKVQGETFKIPDEILKKQEEGQELTKEEKIVIKTKLDIFHALDDRQLIEIGKKGKSKTKKAILETVSQIDIKEEIIELDEKGKEKEAAELSRKKAVLKGPGFRIKFSEKRQPIKGKQTKLDEY